MSFSHSTLSLAIFAVFTATAYADDDSFALSDQQSNPTAVNLNTIVIEAEKTNEIGKTIYTKEDLEKVPNSSKNITDFLKVNPNVQFSQDWKSGKQQGELNAADISINGGLTYDNKFLVNGMSINNNLNPASSAGSNSNSDLRGSSQTVSINTDLICDLTVLDSNVSAEYGEFVGGVVSANTCAPKTPKGELHGSISYDYTSDDWSRINFIDDAEKLSYENSTSESIQPAFVKQGISANVYGKLTDNLGFSLAGSHRWSDIPLKTELNNVDRHDQNRESNNFSFEGYYTPSDQHQYKFGVQFFESDDNFYQSKVLNSNSNHISNSKSVYFNAQDDLGVAKIEQQFNYQKQNSHKTANSELYSWLKSETKNWNVSGTLAQEGGFGNMEQEEEKLEYSFKATFDPIKTGKLTQTIKMGTGYGHYDAYWKRSEDVYWYVVNGAAANLNGASCSSIDGITYDACDEGMTTVGHYDGQYARTRTAYHAGEINIRQDRWNAYIEDSFTLGKYWSGSIGLRNDYDSITKSNNLAPRTALNFMPFANPNLKISAGWNRYYGLNAFANALESRKRLLQATDTRNSVDAEWKEVEGSSYGAMGVNGDLQSPFSDETVFALSGQQANIDWMLKWVNRKNKDQVRKTAFVTVDKPETSGSYTEYSYDNSGQSTADTMTFSIKNHTPFEVMGSTHTLALNISYSDIERNFNSYNDSFSDPNEKIYYDGYLIKSADRPADNFNQPWVFRANWDIGFNKIPLHISNFFSLTEAYDKMKLKTNGYTDETGTYDSYLATKNPTSFNWDMRTTYEIPIAKDLKSIIGLTINNVTNKKNTYIDDNGYSYSSIGRQFIADVTFKF